MPARRGPSKSSPPISTRTPWPSPAPVSTRCPSPPTSKRRDCRACALFRQARRHRLPDRQGRPRVDHLCHPGFDRGPALLETRPDRLPQSPDLPGAGRSAADHHPVSLRAEARRPDRPWGTSEGVNGQDGDVRAGSKEVARLSPPRRTPAARRGGAGERGCKPPAPQQTQGAYTPRSPAPPRRAAGVRRHSPNTPANSCWNRSPPATVLIDRRHRVLYLHGPTRRYLHLPAGEPTLDLTAMADDELGTRSVAVLHRAAYDGRPRPPPAST